MLFSISGSFLWIYNTKSCISLWTSVFMPALATNGLVPQQYFKDKESDPIPRISATYRAKYQYKIYQI